MIWDAIVLGGGFYGCNTALMLRRHGFKNVMLVEPGQLCGAATTVNQNRIHSGSHYMRHQATAGSAARSYLRFILDYADAVAPKQSHLYGIAQDSKTTPEDFNKLIELHGLRAVEIELPRLFTNKIIAAYAVDERSFNIHIMRRIIEQRLDLAGVVRKKSQGHVGGGQEGDPISVYLLEGKWVPYQTRYLFNCTYAMLEHVGVDIKTKLKKEWCEVALVSAPDALKNTDITIMDGPYWSLMQYPAVPHMHALTHVQYTPHREWTDKEGPDGVVYTSNFNLMRDSAREYVPVMEYCKYGRSLWTTRVVLAENEQDDGRPVLIEFSKNNPRIISILGSKFQSFYDVEEWFEGRQWGR